MSCCHGVPQLSSCHLVPQTVVLLPPCAANRCLVATSCHEQLSCCHFVPQTVVLLPPCATVVLLPICATNSYPVATWCHTERTLLLPPGDTTNELCCRVMANELYELCASCSLIPNTQLWLSVLYRVIPSTHSCDWVSFTVLFPIHRVVTARLIPNTWNCDWVPRTVLFPIHSCDRVSCTVLFPIHRVVTARHIIVFEWLVQSYS